MERIDVEALPPEWRNLAEYIRDNLDGDPYAAHRILHSARRRHRSVWSRVREYMLEPVPTWVLFLAVLLAVPLHRGVRWLLGL